jgi:hypothetical protein
MRRIQIVPALIASILATTAMAAAPASYWAKVDGNTLIISGRAATLQTCRAGVHFSYLDLAADNSSGERHDGFFMCPQKEMEPGKAMELCRRTITTIRDIKVTTPVDVTCK